MIRVIVVSSSIFMHSSDHLIAVATIISSYFPRHENVSEKID